MTAPLVHVPSQHASLMFQSRRQTNTPRNIIEHRPDRVGVPPWLLPLRNRVADGRARVIRDSSCLPDFELAIPTQVYPNLVHVAYVL